MKNKYIIIFISLFLLSCINKIDLEQKGSISLSIKWNNENTSSNNSNTSRAIKYGTETITVKIHQKGNPETTQEKIITNTGATKYNVEFDNLIQGTWHVLISARDSMNYLLSEYENFVEVTSQESTAINTDFSELNNIFIYDGYLSQGYAIPDGATDITNGYLAIYFKGFQDLDKNSGINLANSFIKFYSFNINDYTADIPISSLGPQVVLVGVGDYIYNLSPNTKQYWKAIISIDYGGVIYTKESPVYSFTTGSGGQFTAP